MPELPAVEAAVWVTVGGGPNCARSFAARSLAVLMSVRMALEMAEATKLAIENGTMTMARQMATTQYLRKVARVPSVHAFRLSAVTGLSCAESFPSALSRLAVVSGVHPALVPALACKMSLRMLSSMPIPRAAAYLS